MPFTDYTDKVLTSHMFGNVIYTPPQVLYIALSTTIPTQSKGESPYWNFTEPVGSGYARIEVMNDSINWVEAEEQPPDGYIQQNGSLLTFSKAVGPWGKILSFGIYDKPTEGNLLGYGILEEHQTLTNGDIVSFPIGYLTITLS